jgi:signal transduction histidine kinase
MKARSITWYLMACLQVCCLPGMQQALFAQQAAFDAPGVPPFKFYSPKEYGASRQSWGMVQDKRGVILFGNNQGLLSFDGLNWRLTPSPNGAIIRSLAMDEEGVVYYGGRNDFGFLSSDSLGRFQLISLREKVPKDIDDFKDVWEVRCSGGKEYFQTYNHLFVLDVAGGRQWERLSVRTVSTPNKLFSCSIIDGACYVYEQGAGLKYLTEGQLKLVPQGEFFRDLTIVEILPWFPGSHSAKMLLCGLNKGLFFWDGNDFQPFRVENRAAALLATAKITNARYLSDGTLALATDNYGLFVLNEQGQLVQHLHTGNGFPTNDTNDLLPDNQDGLWISTSAGLARVEIPAALSLFSAPFNLSQEIFSITSHRDRLYVGAISGLFVSPLTKGQAFEQVAGPKTAAFSVLSAGDDLLAAFPYAGVFQLEGNKLQEIPGDVPVKLQQSRYSDNLVFVGGGSVKYTFNILYKSAQGWKRILTSPLIKDEIRYVEEEAPGVLWLGTRSKGFIRLESAGLQTLVDRGYPDFSLADSLPVEIERYPESLGTSAFRARPYYVHGRLYMASSEGMKQVDRNSGKLLPDSTLGPVLADTLVTVNHLLAGKDGTIWVNYARKDAPSATIGQLIPNPQGGYTLSDQPQMRRIVDAPLTTMFTHPEAAGAVWFGSTDGLIKYKPSVKRAYRAEFPTLIRAVSVRGDSLLFGGDALANGLSPAPPVLAYTDNALRFEYSAASYELPESTTYQYQLEGFDKSWSGWINENKKDYTNLPEGDYVFRVRSKNIYGIEGEEATFPFEVLPPWYRSWWAYTFFGLLAAGLAGFLAIVYNRWRTRQLEAQNRKLEESVREKTQEILIAQEQLLVQEKMASLGQIVAGIAHEIKNPLNFVHNFSEGSLELLEALQKELQRYRSAPDESTYRNMLAGLEDLRQTSADINKHGNRANRIIQSMMDHARGTPSSLQPVNLNRLVESNVNLAYHGFQTPDPSFKLQIQKNLDPSLSRLHVYPQDLGRVILNLLNNACHAVQQKHKGSSNSYSPTIWINTSNEGKEAIIRIRDNGPGIPEAIREKIFMPFFTTKSPGEGSTGLGLSISYDIIVKRHRGKIEVQSEEGAFTEFVIRLPKE